MLPGYIMTDDMVIMEKDIKSVFCNETQCKVMYGKGNHNIINVEVREIISKQSKNQRYI